MSKNCKFERMESLLSIACFTDKRILNVQLANNNRSLKCMPLTPKIGAQDILSRLQVVDIDGYIDWERVDQLSVVPTRRKLSGINNADFDGVRIDMDKALFAFGKEQDTQLVRFLR